MNLAFFKLESKDPRPVSFREVTDAVGRDILRQGPVFEGQGLKIEVVEIALDRVEHLLQTHPRLDCDAAIESIILYRDILP